MAFIAMFSDILKLREEQEKEIQRYKDQMDDIESAWQKRLSNSRKEMEELQAKERQHLEEERQIPHFCNLNEDPALNGKLIHLVKAAESVVGNGKDKTNPEIVLNGPRIAKRHAKVTKQGGKVMLTPLDGLVLHNGVELKETVQLRHEDRIRFGSNNLFVFTHPQEASELKAKGKHPRDVTYEFAQSEIAKNSGLQFSDEDSLLQEEVMTIMQLVQDVNAMADDMDKPVDFSVLLVSAEARGLDKGRTEVYVKVQDLDTGNEFLWNKNRFLNRQVHMQQMYQSFEEGGSPEPVDKEKDPFWEPPETDVIVGVVSVPLNYLSHMLDFQDEPLTVIDYKAKQSGFLKVALLPCDSQGNEQVELCVEDPMDLVNKPMAFRIKVQQAMNLPERIVQSWCQYKFYRDMEYTRSPVEQGRNPVFNHVKLYRFHKEDVNHRFVDYLRERSLSIEIWGKQGDRVTTGGPAANRLRKSHLQEERIAEELNEWKTTAQQLQKKLDQIQLLVDRKQGKSPTIEKIKKILQEPTDAGNGDT
ncbi:hypothetical protein LSAT2_032357 [Lamellibrachia satsuma]|nr:hypothetical protein LSAT2_032357 [Lamellibrachia satsuma]